ncbi:hypothetical protein IIJ62_003862 [Salmonella enterica subsp. enterica serovar Chester]|nr:hypothetical protein [Salmonella enterica subsp. enterica serovar Chester]EEP2058795.1 hypothetical protein [Salmonella enterica]EGR9913389.1 hypothetical protein [Salmonella enterica subsp. enterica serovar Sandiego]EEP6404928.1 hypothetical protein [Salmonella enterica subsp. enterica serovar Chester]EEP8209039.1 hypothetical protein [Salmonella enterica subsp. enterica serovar Chester]
MVGSAPEALDTLQELADALGNDPNFATTVLNKLAGKQPLDETLTALSGKSTDGLIEYVGLRETINHAADALQKSEWWRYSGKAAVCTKYRSAPCIRYGCCSEQTGITRRASGTDWYDKRQR